MYKRWTRTKFKSSMSRHRHITHTCRRSSKLDCWFSIWTSWLRIKDKSSLSLWFLRKSSVTLLLTTTVDAGLSSWHGATRDPFLYPSTFLLKSARFVSGFVNLFFSKLLPSGIFSFLSLQSTSKAPEALDTAISTFQSEGFLLPSFRNNAEFGFLSLLFKGLLFLAVVADELSAGVNRLVTTGLFLNWGVSKAAPREFLDPDR